MRTTQNPSSPSYPLAFEDIRALKTQFLKPAPVTFPGGSGDPAYCAHASTRTIFDSTVDGIAPGGTSGVLSGPGNVEGIQLYAEIAYPSNLNDDYLSFFVDGEGTASINIPLGHLFNCLCISSTNTVFPFISKVNVLNGGSGYSSNPTATFSSDGGFPDPTGTATAAGGIVTAVAVNNGAGGATKQASIQFSGGGGSGAVAQTVYQTRPTYATDQISCDYIGQGFGLGGYRKLFVPWKTSLVIKYNCVGTGGTDPARLFTQVSYRNGIIPFWRHGGRRLRLRQAMVGTIAPCPFLSTSGSSTLGGPFVSKAALSNTDLINVSGVRGELDSVTLEIRNGNFTYAAFPSELEGHTKIYIDGTQRQEWGGTEDFVGTHVFGYELQQKLDHWSMVYAGGMGPIDAGHIAVMHRMWNKLPGGFDQLAFDNALRINWTAGDAGVNSGAGTIGLAANVLYYTDS